MASTPTESTTLEKQAEPTQAGRLLMLTTLPEDQAAPTTGKLPSQRLPVLIPGSIRNKPRTMSSVERLSRKWRIGVPLLVLCCVLFTSLIFLTPLGTSLRDTSAALVIGQFQAFGHPDSQVNAHPLPTQPPTTPVRKTYTREELVRIAEQAADSAGISRTYFVNQIQAESGFNPNAVSPAGAIGIAQFMPATAAGLGIDPWDPVSALYGSARYMKRLSDSYGGNYAKALAAYNGGPGSVTRAVNDCGESAWMNCLVTETRNYIRKIMGI